ncbi:WhiB family transcriptional regulator [Nonomuraea purpurea]|uniref:WhiB family transcriptional regulator n=1 Tax=Nonomuraea purpurea TaxID=1849276 RepID=A0ABV8GPG0_9ACTN
MASRIKRALIFPEWHTRAACRGVPGWVFVNDTEPLRGGRPRPSYNEAKAKAYCKGCPVRERCLDEAIAMGEEDTVRGGLNSDELRKERQRRRGLASAAA